MIRLGRPLAAKSVARTPETTQNFNPNQARHTKMKNRRIEPKVVSTWFSSTWPNILMTLVICLASASTGLLSSTAGARTLTLADRGASPYQIVLSTNAIASEHYAAEELQRYLQKITNAKFPIATDAA